MFIFKLFSLAVVVGYTIAPSVASADFSDTQPMNLELMKAAAFARCQSPFVAPVAAPIPMLDPPPPGQTSPGLDFEQALEISTTNLLNQNEFYFNPQPRAAVNTLPMDIFVDQDSSGVYTRKTWADANPDYSAIEPAIGAIPAAGQILTELIVGHEAPAGGGYPELFDFRSSAYVRFAGYPPEIEGSSLRLGAHGIFGLGAPGQPKVTEDFPVIRAFFGSANNAQTANALLLVENSLFCAALSVDMTPGSDATMVVDGYWYTRSDYHWQQDPNTGLVAYSSMYDTPATAAAPDAAAHDSDTMIVSYTDGTQATYPLAPPSSGLSTQDLLANAGGKTPSGWTLANEDRDPSHYAHFAADLGDTNYNFRASYRVDIQASNVQTGVSLYQQNPDGEYGDNIVAVSTVRQDIPKSQSVDQFTHFKYATTAFYPPAPAPAADQCGFIRQAIQNLPASGGTVTIPAGTFTCTSMIIVKASHVRIQGAGQDQTTLRLADQSPAPVLVLGDDVVVEDANGDWVTQTRITDVQVSDLTIDGNVANQNVNDECGAGPCTGDISDIRNNAITIRGASYVTVSRVTAHDAISGGMVTEKYCDHLTVTDFTSYGNHFDGFAGYQTSQSLFQNMNLSRNHGAGISIDIDFDNNHFLGGTLASNGDVGIFARDITGDLFENLDITGSGNHGAFLAYQNDPSTCAHDNEFRSVTIEGSKGYGIDIASPCTGNKVTGNSVFSGNSSGCVYVNPAVTLPLDPTVKCEN